MTKRRMKRRRLSTVERIRRRTMAGLLMAFGLLTQLGVVVPAYGKDGVIEHDPALVDAEREHVGRVSLHLASLLLLMRARVTADAVVPPEGEGPYAYLAPNPNYATAPTNVLTGEPMAFNGWSGLHDGTTVDTTEPTWAVTDTLEDQGSASANMAALQAWVDTAATTATSNRRLLLPTSLRFEGQCVLPRNVTGFWIGIQTEAYASLPTQSDGQYFGTKANRVTWADHETLMPEFRAITNANLPSIISDSYEVQHYFLRGLRFTNPSTFNCRAISVATQAGDITGNGGWIASSGTSNTVTFPSGPANAHVGFMLWVSRGTGVGQARVIQSRAGTTYTISGTWDVIPDSTSRILVLRPPRNVANWAAVGTFDITKCEPRHVTLSQMLVDGNNVSGTNVNGVGITFVLSGRHLAVVDSWTQNTGRTNNQCQDVLIVDGIGPYKLTNNRFGAKSVNRQCIMAGGQSLMGDTDQFLPADIEIRGNTFVEVVGTSDRGNVEIKYGRRWLIEKNVMPPVTDPATNQSGLLLFKLTDQYGPNVNVDASDVIAMSNYMVGCTGGIQLSNDTAGNPGANRLRRCVVKGNLVVRAGGDPNTQPPQALAVAIQYTEIQYNTMLARATGIYPHVIAVFLSNNGDPWSYTDTRYNLLLQAVTNWPTTIGRLDTLVKTDVTFEDNLITYTNVTTYYPGNVYAGGNWDAAGVGFLDRAGGDYRLGSGSLAYQAGPTGADWGAPVALLETFKDEVI